jgi:hypothetical protein
MGRGFRSIALLLFALLGAVKTLAAPGISPNSACAYLAGLIPIAGGPLFLPSYPDAEPGPLRGVGFLYDDSVAAIALVGCGEAERARRIGDAILFAIDHDRFWKDGRLRNAYAAGPLRDDPVKLGGWWDSTEKRWLEDAYQVGSDSGNTAWALLALLALDDATGDRRYREGALKLGAWLALQSDSRGAGGFTGGFAGWEPAPAANRWKSTEHNTDMAAAFTRLAAASGDASWSSRADHAASFVRAMWDEDGTCFAVGTTEDGVTRNPIFAIDAEIWPLLAIRGLAAEKGADIGAAIDGRLKFDGGYAYSEAGKGVWTEGTAQAALLARLSGRDEEAQALLAVVDSQRAAKGGYFATSVAALDTGFSDPSDPRQRRYYYRVPHLGAAAWAALAERGFNPFTGTAVLP